MFNKKLRNYNYIYMKIYNTHTHTHIKFMSAYHKICIKNLFISYLFIGSANSVKLSIYCLFFLGNQSKKSPKYI